MASKKRTQGYGKPTEELELFSWASPEPRPDPNGLRLPGRKLRQKAFLLLRKQPRWGSAVGPLPPL